MNRALLFLFVTLWTAEIAFPEEGKKSVQPPTPPLCATPVPGNAWTISVSYSTDSKSPSAEIAEGLQITRIKCVFGSEVSLVEVTYGNGNVEEAFVFREKVARMFPGAAAASLLLNDQANFASPVFVRGFQGMAWLSEANFEGVEDRGGEPCYKFFKAGQIFQLPEDGISHPDLTAWVKVKDKSPVAFRIGNVDYMYSAVTQARSNISLPKEVVAILDRDRSEEAAIRAMRRK